MVLSVTAVFGGLAAAMAFIITYQEYAKLFDKKRAISVSLRMAATTLVFFLFLGLLASLEGPSSL